MAWCPQGGAKFQLVRLNLLSALVAHPPPCSSFRRHATLDFVNIFYSIQICKMTMKKIDSKLLFALISASVLSACGGGGGSGSGISGLSDDQIKAVAKSANSASYILSFLVGIPDDGSYYISSIYSELSGLNKKSPDIGDICTSGTYTASWSVASSVLVTPGDTMTVNYANCMKINGAVYNGSEKHTVVSVITSEGKYTKTVSSTPMNLTVQKGVNKITIPSGVLSYIRTAPASSDEYPKTYEYKTNVSAILEAPVGELVSGTYDIANAKRTDASVTSGSYSVTESFASSSNNYKDISAVSTRSLVLSTATSKVIPIVYPKYNLFYSGATIEVESFATTTSLSGTNSNGAKISPILISGYSYFN